MTLAQPRAARRPPRAQSSTKVQVVSVNDAPTIAGTVAGQTTTDTTAIHPFSTVTIADADNPPQNLTVTVRLSAAANGALSGASGSYNATTGTYTLTGTASAATAALRALTFTPTLHHVAPGGTESTSFTLSVNDGLAATVFDVGASVVTTGTAGPPSVTFSSVALGANGQFTFSGTYIPGTGATSVTVRNETTVLGVAILNAAARTWSLTVVPPAGVYKFPTAVATDATGASVSASIGFAFVAGIAGQPYATLINTLDATGATTLTKYFNLDGSLYISQAVSFPVSGYTMLTFSGGSFFTGKPYTTYTNLYDSSSRLTATAYYGVTGQSYTSYQNSYDASGRIAAQSFYGVTGQPYTSSVTYYAADGSASGFVQYNGAAVYLSERTTRLANGWASYSFSGAAFSGQFYNSYTTIYDSGGRLRIVDYYGIARQNYTSREETYDVSGRLTGQSFYGVTGQPFTSYVNAYQNGVLQQQSFLGIQNRPYGSYEYFYTAGRLSSQVTNYLDGSHAMQGFQDGVTLSSRSQDVMTGGGSGVTFLFNTGFGHDTVTDLYAHLSGANHDVVSVSVADFADFAALLSHTQTVGGAAVLSAANGDQITLLGMSASSVAANASCFTFHA